MSGLLELLISLALVLAIVFGARWYMYGGKRDFYLDGERYTRHGRSHFTTAMGARIIDPERVATLDEQWTRLTEAHGPRPRATWRPVDPDAPPPRKRWWDRILDVLDHLPRW